MDKDKKQIHPSTDSVIDDGNQDSRHISNTIVTEQVQLTEMEEKTLIQKQHINTMAAARDESISYSET